jgi:hypothetical protein
MSPFSPLRLSPRKPMLNVPFFALEVVSSQTNDAQVARSHVGPSVKPPNPTSPARLC